MAKYKVETDKGTYLVETDDAPGGIMDLTGGQGIRPASPAVSPLAPPPPVPAPLPSGLSGPSALDLEKQRVALQMDPSSIPAGTDPYVANSTMQAQRIAKILPESYQRILQNLVGGMMAKERTTDPIQKELAKGAMYDGAKEAGKVAAVQGIDLATGAAPWEHALDLMLGNDMPFTTLGARGVGSAMGAVGKMLPRAASSLRPATRIMDNLEPITSPALRPGMAALLHGAAIQAGANAGYKLDTAPNLDPTALQFDPKGGQALSPGMNAFMAAINLGGAGLAAGQGALRQAPSYDAQKILDFGADKSGVPADQFMGGKSTPPVQPTQFSGLGRASFGLPGPGGAATMNPSMPLMGDPIQAVLDHLRDIAGTTKTAVQTGARALGSLQSAESAVQPGFATFAKKVTPKGAKNVNPADVASGQPDQQPPKKDDKLASSEPPVVNPASPSGPVIPGSVAPGNAGDAVPRVAYGKPVTLRVGDDTYPARYVARPVEDYQTSHNPVSFQKNPEYAYDNTRRYDEPDAAGRIASRSTKEGFDPGYIDGVDQTATNGPGVSAVDSRLPDKNNVLGANGRTNIVKRVYAQDPEGFGLRERYLTNSQAHYGIDPAELSKIEHPMVHMEIDTSKMSRDEIQRIINHLNDPPMAAMSPEESAAAMARDLMDRPHSVNFLGGIMEHNPDSSLRDLLRDKNGVFIVNRLLKDGVIPETQRAAYLNPHTGAVTEHAKDSLENMLTAGIFRDTDQFIGTTPDVRNRLSRIGLSHMATRNTPYDLTHEMHDAIDLVNRAKASGQTVGAITDNLSMFGDEGAPEYSPAATVLAKEIVGSTPTNLAKNFRSYARNASKFRNTNVDEASVLKPEQALGRLVANGGEAAGGGVESVPIRPRPEPVASPAAPEAPAAEPASAPPPAPKAPKPAAAPAAPAAPDEEPKHPFIAAAKRLNEAMGRKVKGTTPDTLHNALMTAHTDPKLGDLAAQHAMIDAARQITPDEFEAMSEFAVAKRDSWSKENRTHVADFWKATKPEKWAKLTGVWDNVAARLGIMPEEAEDFGDALAQIRAKVARETNWQKVTNVRATKVPLDKALDLAEHATQHPNTIPTETATPPPQGRRPIWEGKVGEAAPPPVEVPKPGQPALPSGRVPGTGVPKQPPVPRQPQAPIWNGLGEPHGGPAPQLADLPHSPALPSGRVPGQPQPQAPQPQRRPLWEGLNNQPPAQQPPAPGPMTPDEIRARVGDAQFQRFAKGQNAQAPTPDPAAAQQRARETAMMQVGKFLQGIFDRGTGSFHEDSGNKVADFIAKNRKLVDLATDGNSQGLQAMFDNQGSTWQRYNQSTIKSTGAPKPIGRIGKGISIPGLGQMGFYKDVPNPLNVRKVAAMDPTSKAAEQMRELAKQGDVSPSWLGVALKHIFALGR